MFHRAEKMIPRKEKSQQKTSLQGQTSRQKQVVPTIFGAKKNCWPPKIWGRNDPKISPADVWIFFFSNSPKKSKNHIITSCICMAFSKSEPWIQKKKLSSTEINAPKKKSRKRGRAWVVVTPAASLVEPPSRCCGDRGGKDHPKRCLKGGSSKELTWKNFRKWTWRRKINRKKLGVFKREGHFVFECVKV